MTDYEKDTITLMAKMDDLLKKEMMQIKILEFKRDVCDIILQNVENVQKEISGKDARYVELKLSGMHYDVRDEMTQSFLDLVSSFPDISAQNINDQMNTLFMLQVFISLMAEQMKKGDNRDVVEREFARMRAGIHENHHALINFIVFRKNTLAVRLAVESLEKVSS